MLRAAQWLGVLGGLAALIAAVVSLIVYGETIPYADRILFGIAAFFLAAVASTGGLLLRGRPVVGTVLLVASSILGYAAMNLFAINTWYGAAALLCLVAALLALGALRRSPTGTVLQWLLLVVLAGGAVGAYVFGGLYETVVFVALFIAALVLRVARPVASA